MRYPSANTCSREVGAELTGSSSASPLGDGSSPLLTFLTVATHIAERLSGSMASNFIPSLNQSPFWSTSLTWWVTHGERQKHEGGGRRGGGGCHSIKSTKVLHRHKLNAHTLKSPQTTTHNWTSAVLRESFSSELPSEITVQGRRPDRPSSLKHLKCEHIHQAVTEVKTLEQYIQESSPQGPEEVKEHKGSSRPSASNPESCCTVTGRTDTLKCGSLNR